MKKKSQQISICILSIYLKRSEKELAQEQSLLQIHRYKPSLKIITNKFLQIVPNELLIEKNAKNLKEEILGKKKVRKIFYNFFS